MAAELTFVPGIQTKADVLTILAKAMSLLADGKTLMQWENDGTRSIKAFTCPVQEVINACNKFLQAVDPTTYGRRIRRTSPSYF
jgi:hypothetical protein